MSVALDWTMRRLYDAKKIEVLKVATLVARNASETMAVPMVESGVVCVWRQSGFSCRDLQK
jgi:hypothetical protein